MIDLRDCEGFPMRRFSFGFVPPASRQSSLFLILLVGTLYSLTTSVLSAQSLTFAGATPSVNFGNANLCASRKTTPAPCSTTQTLSYQVTASGTLGRINVVTSGALNLDFTLSGGGSCTGPVTEGTTCTVAVKFAPRFPGQRAGAVQIFNAGGTLVAQTPIYGTGIGPLLGFTPGTLVKLAFPGELGGPLAVDGAGNIFESDYELGLQELSVGAGTPVHILNQLYEVVGLAVDGAGDLFVDDRYYEGSPYRVLKLPSGGGPLTSIKIAFNGLPYPGFLTSDGAGDVFLSTDRDGSDNPSYDEVIESPAGATSNAAQKVLATVPNQPNLAADPAGDLFLLYSPDSQYEIFGSANTVLTELPAGGGAPITLGAKLGFLEGLGMDGVGNFYSSETPDGFDEAGADSLVEIPAGGGVPTPFFSTDSQITSYLVLTPAGDIIFGKDEFTAIYELQRSQASPLNFGMTAAGSTSTLPLTIKNNGNALLTVTASTDSPGYSVAGAQPANCLAGIAPAHSCAVQVAFSPTSAGPHTGC
jgi:hypothetical protein